MEKNEIGGSNRTREKILLDQIPFRLERAELKKWLPAVLGDAEPEVESLVAEAGSLARPRVLYRAAYIEDRGDDWVTAGGVTFQSRVLAVNLEPAHRFFPFVATCGSELEAWSRRLSDVLLKSVAEAIKGLALVAALRAFDQDLAERFKPGKMAVMNPGSIKEWPIEEQKKLFALLGDVQAEIGVELLESCLMIPTKTVSGLRYPTQTRFESCQLCPRQSCIGRRAPHDPDLYDRRYGKK